MLTCDKVMTMGMLGMGRGCCVWVVAYGFFSSSSASINFHKTNCEFVMLLLIILVLLIEEGKEFLFFKRRETIFFPNAMYKKGRYPQFFGLVRFGFGHKICMLDAYSGNSVWFDLELNRCSPLRFCAI